MKDLQLLVVLALVFFGLQTSAQELSFKSELAYFAGEWIGDGKFANGKPIKAELQFTFEMDSLYLVGKHRDSPPNAFSADTYWRVDSKTKSVKAVMLDNTGSERIFKSEGSMSDSLVLQRSFEVLARGTVTERFIYKILNGDRFKMEYQVKMSDKPWRMVDYLIFERRK